MRVFIFFLIVIFHAGSAAALSNKPGLDEALWLNLSPGPAAKAPSCDVHGGPVATTRPVSVSAPEKSDKKAGKGSGVTYSHGEGRGRPRTAGAFESEHRPSPVRTYFLQGPPPSPSAKAYLLHPDGSHIEIKLIRGLQNKVSFKMPMTDDYCHGPNNVYVVDQEVRDGELIVRVAKWLTIHHSCGWGHDYRNDSDRLMARSLELVPLEIVINDLWDGNFHVRTSSGDQLDIQVLAHGVPMKDATVTLTTEKKWSHTAITGANGTAKVQLINDYYPSAWNTFKRNHRGRLAVKAEYRLEQSGEFLGQPYSKVRYITTLPWKYTPALTDYASYTYGLSVGLGVILVSGLGIYAFRERRRKPYKSINLDG